MKYSPEMTSSNSLLFSSIVQPVPGNKGSWPERLTVKDDQKRPPFDGTDLPRWQSLKSMEALLLHEK